MDESTTTPRTLLLVDGMNIGRRILKAIDEADPVKLADNAVTALWGSLHRAIKTHQPQYMLSVFDGSGPTFRHALYPAYKKDREPPPEEYLAKLELCKQRMNEAGIPTRTCAGYEAEDLIATVALKAVRRGFNVVILSNDKDLAYLCDHNVKVFDHFTGTAHDEAWIQAKFGVRAAQLQDYLAFCGDEVDRVPGVNGIGPKKSATLLKTYQTLTGVLQAAANEEIKGSLGKVLVEEAHLALLSRKLIELNTAIPMDFTPRDLRLASLNDLKHAQRAFQTELQPSEPRKPSSMRP